MTAVASAALVAQAVEALGVGGLAKRGVATHGEKAPAARTIRAITSFSEDEKPRVKYPSLS